MGDEWQRWAWVEKNICSRFTVDKSLNISFIPRETIHELISSFSKKVLQMTKPRKVRWLIQSHIPVAGSETGKMCQFRPHPFRPSYNSGMNGGLTGMVTAGSRERNESGESLFPEFHFCHLKGWGTQHLPDVWWVKPVSCKACSPNPASLNLVSLVWIYFLRGGGSLCHHSVYS